MNWNVRNNPMHPMITMRFVAMRSRVNVPDNLKAKVQIWLKSICRLAKLCLWDYSLIMDLIIAGAPVSIKLWYPVTPMRVVKHLNKGDLMAYCDYTRMVRGSASPTTSEHLLVRMFRIIKSRTIFSRSASALYFWLHVRICNSWELIYGRHLISYATSIKKLNLLASIFGIQWADMYSRYSLAEFVDGRMFLNGNIVQFSTVGCVFSLKARFLSEDLSRKFMNWLLFDFEFPDIGYELERITRLGYQTESAEHFIILDGKITNFICVIIKYTGIEFYVELNSIERFNQRLRENASQTICEVITGRPKNKTVNYLAWPAQRVPGGYGL